MPRQGMTRSSHEPITGARTGARPLTSASRLSIRTSGRPPNRSRTIAMATTPPAAAPMPCSARATPSSSTLGANAAPTQARMCTSVARISGSAAADLVAPRADQQLPETEADGRGRQRQLDRRRRDAEVALQRRQRRQVRVDRERPESGQRAQDQDVGEALATGERVSGMHDGGHDGGHERSPWGVVGRGCRCGRETTEHRDGESRCRERPVESIRFPDDSQLSGKRRPRCDRAHRRFLVVRIPAAESAGGGELRAGVRRTGRRGAARTRSSAAPIISTSDPSIARAIRSFSALAASACAVTSAGSTLRVERVQRPEEPAEHDQLRDRRRWSRCAEPWRGSRADGPPRRGRAVSPAATASASARSSSSASAAAIPSTREQRLLADLGLEAADRAAVAAHARGVDQGVPELARVAADPGERAAADDRRPRRCRMRRR